MVQQLCDKHTDDDFGVQRKFEHDVKTNISITLRQTGNKCYSYVPLVLKLNMDVLKKNHLSSNRQSQFAIFTTCEIPTDHIKWRATLEISERNQTKIKCHVGLLG